MTLVAPTGTTAIEYVATPIGTLEIKANSHGVECIQFVEEIHRYVPNEHTQHAKNWLIAYFEGHKTPFTAPLQLSGTPFQMKIWHLLRDIPFGATLSYSAIALKYDEKTHVRSVAGAIARNPLLLAIPCHRVIGKSGQLRGYAGGLSRKEWLLSHEKGIYDLSLFPA